MSGNTVNILHLSDLHFGAEPGTGKVTNTALEIKELTLKKLIENLEKMEESWRPEVVVVSGDIAWRASQSDYKQAGEWIKKLLDTLKLSPNELLLCPGNHDIIRNKTKSLKLPENTDSADDILRLEDIDAFDKAFETYIKFCSEFGIPKLTAGKEDYYLVGQRIIKGIRFVMLNSAWFCRDNNDDGNLWLGLPQILVMDNNRQLASTEKYDEDTITVVAHHHPKGSLNTQDRNNYGTRINTYEYLSKRSHIILTGHEHPAAPETHLIGNARIFTGGATYSGNNYWNCFSILKVDKDKRTVSQKGYKFDPSSGNWEPIPLQRPYSLKLVKSEGDTDTTSSPSNNWFKELLDGTTSADILAQLDSGIPGSELGCRVIEWFRDEKLRFKGFCGRRQMLGELVDSIDAGIEVYGVGGTGKTTLVQLALLVKKLSGTRIAVVAPRQSYMSGSGYARFKDFCGESFKETGENITFSDIVDAFKLSDEDRKKETAEKMNIIGRLIEEQNTILYIDDFHLADQEVKDFVRGIRKNKIITAKVKQDCAKKSKLIQGVEEEAQDRLIDIVQQETGQELSHTERERIKKLVQGHPVSTELLVRNHQSINFKSLEEFNLEALDDAVSGMEEFLRRIVDDIFSTDNKTYELLKDLAVINTDVRGNISEAACYEAYKDWDNNSKKKLLDTGMIKKIDDGIYEFSFRHIQELLLDKVSGRHLRALDYYKYKKRTGEFTQDDEVEMLYHKVKHSAEKGHAFEIQNMVKTVSNVHSGYERLIVIGRILKNNLKGEHRNVVLNFMGHLYFDLKRYDEAEREYDEALDLAKKVAHKTNNDTDIDSVAVVYNNIANLYKEIKNYDNAEKAYKESLKIRKELVNRNKDLYKLGLSIVQNNIGTLYMELIQYEKAETAYQEALEIRKELVKAKPDLYKYDLSVTQNNIGSLYMELTQYDKAETAYQEALEIRKELVKTKPDLYKYDLSITQNNIGILFMMQKQYEKAERAYQEALEIRKELVKIKPDLYKHDFATTQNNIGSLYAKLKRYDKAEAAYQEALCIYKELAKSKPDLYKQDLARVKDDIGCFFIKCNRPEAINLIKEALEAFLELEKEKQGLNSSSLGCAENNLGEFFFWKKDFSKAEEQFIKSLNIFERLESERPGIYQVNLTWLKMNFGKLYVETGKTKEGIAELNSALAKRELLDDYGAECFEYLAKAYEGLGNHETVAENYLKAAEANLEVFQLGVNCGDDIQRCLKLVESMGDENTRKKAGDVMEAYRQAAASRS